MIWWAIVLFAIFLIGVTKSGFGAGVGLMIVPMTTIAMGHTARGSEAALGLMLPLLVAGDLFAVWQYRKMFRPGMPAVGVLRRLLPGGIVGVVIGGFLLYWLHSQTRLVGALIRIEIGFESIGLVALHWWRQFRGVQTHLMPEPWRSHITGCFSGISSTLAHAAGPIVAMYLLPLNLDRQLFVGTCALFFFVLNSSKLPAYFGSGLFDRAPVSFSLQFLPLVAAGAIAGLWLNRRLSDKVFTAIVYFVTFCLGWYVLIEGIGMLRAA
ncbi:MAG TPA: sulfite exporter TauE/SafE family protein [Tepidisphaeraceae bacterium]|nr:sulfite exporter TauE/SafE family protein [Tepidisphaeraceae bacterium]